jgi:triacylglycerol lipase
MSTAEENAGTAQEKAEVKDAIRTLSSPLANPISKLSLLKQSLLFAELSNLSYFKPEIISKAVKAIGIEDYSLIEDGNGQAYVFTTHDDCVVVFRGTEPDDINDIKADIDAVMIVAETVGRVHRGFKREVDELWQPLENLLRENTKPLWFAGHSLGGAMATIAAGRCVLSPIPSNPEALFTYGSPRVGNGRYINYVKLDHYRWVNNNDIVTRMPPRWLGYKHAGREMYMDCNGHIRTLTAWPKFKDRWRGIFNSMRLKKIDLVSDHNITLYIEYLHAAVQAEESGQLQPLKKGVCKKSYSEA